MAKPFLKWAGGKTQLIHDISSQLPHYAAASEFTYIEPFAGSGAFFFWLARNYPNMEKAIINDINTDLINCYKTIKSDIDSLISQLEIYQQEYHTLNEREEEKKEYYYAKRDLFNTKTADNTQNAALFIFLNRTCFNGLYRVNKSGQFNVPIGKYKNPKICDKENLLEVHQLLQNVIILNSDYSETLKHAERNSFFYIDPPYKPLNTTSSFNSYSSDIFDDREQHRLKEFCDEISNQGFQWILSNSDVKQSGDNFFDQLYENYKILRVNATRRINSLPEKRGKLTELLIMGKS